MRARAVFILPAIVLPVAFALLALASPMVFASGGDTPPPRAEDAWPEKPKDFRDGYVAIDHKEFRKAIELFTREVGAHPDDPDANNFLGYAYRKVGDFENALKYYQRVLSLDPKHKGAYEYLGEAYLDLNDLPNAKAQLAKLDDICWLGCPEYYELKDAIRAYEKKQKS
jgi:tetratricopeptide (TPR) repeat protein